MWLYPLEAVGIDPPSAEVDCPVAKLHVSRSQSNESPSLCSKVMKPPNDEELLLEFLNLFLASVNWTTSPLLPLPVPGQDTQLLAWLGPHLRGPGVQ